MLDIFNDDAFSVQELTAAINADVAVPGQLNNSGLFSEDGITSTTFSIEKEGKTLSLVPSQSRGAPGATIEKPKSTLIPFNTIHLPQDDNLQADEVLGARAFGTENQLKTVSAEVTKRLMTMRRNIDATIEHLKVGALKGLVVDADGTTPLMNIYDKFGLTQTEFGFNIAGITNVTDQCRKLSDLVEDEMDGIPFEGVRVYCGRNFYNELVSHSDVEAKYARWNDGQFNREANNKNFTFGEIEFVKYRGQVGGYRFIGDDEAYAVAYGSPDLFLGRFAPANYVESVGTKGLPYYAKMAEARMGKGIDLEAQSNPCFFCTKPQAVIKLRKGA